MAASRHSVSTSRWCPPRSAREPAAPSHRHLFRLCPHFGRHFAPVGGEGVCCGPSNAFRRHYATLVCVCVPYVLCTSPPVFSHPVQCLLDCLSRPTTVAVHSSHCGVVVRCLTKMEWGWFFSQSAFLADFSRPKVIELLSSRFFLRVLSGGRQRSWGNSCVVETLDHSGLGEMLKPFCCWKRKPTCFSKPVRFWGS